jgi:septum site-determining protein MinC
MTEQTPVVKMKGVGDSLWVTVATDAPMDQIETELEVLFDPLKHMAHATSVVLDANSPERYRKIQTFLNEKYRLKKIAPPKKDEDPKENPPKMKSNATNLAHHKSNTLVLSGRIRSGQTVQAKRHLVILGDVNPGCELVAGGDIIVLGSLMGTAAAGQPNNGDAIILALDFRPLQVSIAGVVAAGLPPSDQNKPEFAYLENDSIVVDNYLTANPFKRMPWPAVR